jgi:hypothetical protein
MRRRAPGWAAGRALRTYFLFLEIWHKVELHQMTGRVAECPVDEMNRPRGAGRAALRIPPSAVQVAALFARWRAELATCRKFARHHLKTGELAFHYCFVPEGQPLTLTRLIRAAGLRWPAEEEFRLGKDCFGLDQAQVRLHTAIARHTVLVMAARAVCAITAAQLKDRTDTQAAPPARPDQPPPAGPA